MGKVNSFKLQYTFDERRDESDTIIRKYPDRVLVIIERYPKTDLPEMEKRKYLVLRDMTIWQFVHILSSRLRLSPGKALFVFVRNTLPQTAARKPLANSNSINLFLCGGPSTYVNSSCKEIVAMSKVYIQ